MSYPALSALVASTASTAIAGPIVRSWLHRRRNYDFPNDRSSHTVPTPRGGGLACLVGAVAGTVSAGLAERKVSAEWIVASAALGAVGWLDDLVSLQASHRLSIQLVAGATIGARSGGPRGALVGAIVMPAIVNAFNFMDGINGISGGTAAAWGLSLSTNETFESEARMQGAVAAGMGLGFLPYNVPDATMFLGDVGSYLFGGGIATTVIQSSFRSGSFELWGAASSVSPLIPYLADTGSTIVKRATRGEPVMQAHREHVYQRLVRETGWAHWRVSGLAALMAAICGYFYRTPKRSLGVLPVVGVYLTAPAIARSFGSA